jgi:luciferase-type oxidoreductase
MAPDTHLPDAFPSINRGYDTTFRPGRLSVGLVVPITSYPRGPVPSLERHLERVQLAESLGFAAVWLRDVPFDVPSFGDAGQLFDPFVYLGFLAARTERVALGVASIILPLRHPAHVAKAAASADVLSGGRLILGVASGDRPAEYPALDTPFDSRGERFRLAFEYIRRMPEHAPSFQSPLGRVGGGMDMLPKPTGARIPMLITGGSQQHPDWLAAHGDGWMVYPQHPAAQARILRARRDAARAPGVPDRPFLQPLYVDLDDDPYAHARQIHLGFRLGVHTLRDHLKALESAGINHVAINLRFATGDVEDTMRTLATELFPHFHDPAETP